VIGNVGRLRGNLTLIPGASPDDGLLDLYIASPRRFQVDLVIFLGASVMSR
jgi:diacylglycerol kinase family enzyme